MRIGIFTYPLNYNYGNLLQAYALLIYLKREGIEVEIIDRRKHKSSTLGKMKLLVKRFLSGVHVLKQEQYFNMMAGFDSFIRQYLHPKTKLIYNKEQLANIILRNHYDTIIVGSDQIWRYEYMKDNIYNYFLDFVPDNIKKVVYAASFGTNIWQFDEKQTQKIAHLAQRFQGISVREDSAVELCKTYLNIDAYHLIDPTLLLEKEDYLTLMKDIKSVDIKKNLFQYILDEDENKKNIINQLNTYLGLPICKFSLRDMQYEQQEIKTNKPTQAWLKGIYNSEFVVTDSFHGTVFAILFNKPFLSLGNENRGLTRIVSLLKMFNLEYRLILPSNIDMINSIQAPIQWDYVNQILKQKREEANKFISGTIFNEK